jgi:hypothetical protein
MRSNSQIKQEEVKVAYVDEKRYEVGCRRSRQHVTIL